MCQSKAQGGRRCALHHPGTRAVLKVVQHTRDLDGPQTDAVFRKALKRARPAVADPTEAEWNAYLDARIYRLALDEIDNPTYERLARRLHAAKTDVPDARTYAALQDIEMRAEKAVKAINRQVETAAAFRGADLDEVRERFAAYRAQYRKDLRTLPAAERPDPPQEWVEGFTTRDMMSVSAPADRATLYAIYRCQADPHAFASTTGKRFASIDLETAGPEGKAGFAPENGSIIEVGIMEYDEHGNEIAVYEQLIAPHPEVAARCGTGAVEVHGITMSDVAGAPEWGKVAAQVADRLHGRTLMAQNARFENGWLGHHLTAAGHDFDRHGPTVDTMCIAKQHLPLDNHRLATICAAVGVDYTDGHRALHDARVAGQAFFAIRRAIHATYLSSPARANTPQPPVGYGQRRAPGPDARMIRSEAAEFDPATVTDRWATGAPVAAGAA